MKPVILVVDDSRVDRRLVGGLLNQQTTFDVKFASDGNDALRRMSQSRIDAVVTDIVMPGKGGLQLVQEMRKHYSQTPVVLMTACGNEDISAEALTNGASSYVPKSQLGDRLSLTVARLVNRAMTDRCRSLSGKLMTTSVFHFEIGHDLFMIETVVNTIHRTMSSMQIGDPSDRIRACTALEEAISNAILHGNLEIGEMELAAARRSGGNLAVNRLIEARSRQPNLRDRRARLRAELHRDFARFSICDQGHGFDALSRAGHDLRDYFDAGKDRGLTLMHSLVDDIAFNESANEVTLAKVHA
ncbi:response regulator [Planctomycetes bacterium TBK1r]|uniref:Transcriptional regulatory protein SrrA n=1 Tax=Stieleria magnilauensis TaxID=2527963 RepID=A0ABX5XT24_9BACT|nr:Transcriptional regulatory protein SrrA [Planctomycetes bacterium TBK1r]